MPPNQAVPILPPLRIASVSFLNAKPLIYGLGREPAAKLLLAVPSGLLELLENGQADVALLPVIDYQRLANLVVLPAGGIGCFGPTLTVRIFSRGPIEQIETLACDPDSHTSVALASVILAEKYGRKPNLADLRDASLAPDTPRLLIGDKVVTQEPAGFDHQLDLGEAWRDMTGLPFVFAVWTAQAAANLAGWHDRLTQARVEGLHHVETILQEFCGPMGWPTDIARRYLTEYLKFDIGEPQLQAIRLFHQLAAKHGLINADVRPLRIA